MANGVGSLVNQVRENRIWRSIFRSGSGHSNLRRALFVQQNVFLHLFSIKARKRALEFICDVSNQRQLELVASSGFNHVT